MMFTPRSFFERSPLSELLRLTDGLATMRSSRPGAPALSARHDETAVTVRLEVPGLTADDLELSVEGERLDIAGTLPATDVPEGSTVRARERSTGRFEHRIALPYRVDAARAEARLEHGVLDLKLPRVAEELPRRIEITN